MYKRGESSLYFNLSVDKLHFYVNVEVVSNLDSEAIHSLTGLLNFGTAWQT